MNIVLIYYELRNQTRLFFSNRQNILKTLAQKMDILELNQYECILHVHKMKILNIFI